MSTPPQYGQQPYDQPSHGQEPYGNQQPFGQQPYGHYGTGPSAPHGKAPMSGFAVAGFIISLIGGIVLGPILCIIALSKIRNHGHRGRGLAIAGLIIGGLWIVLVIVAVVAGIGSSPDTTRDQGTGAITEPGTITVDEVKVGDCLQSFDEGTIASLKVIPCTSPHAAEDVAQFNLPDVAWPGDKQIDRAAASGCQKRMPKAAMKGLRSGKLSYSYITPTEADWSRSRAVDCFVTAEKGMLTKPVGSAGASSSGTGSV